MTYFIDETIKEDKEWKKLLKQVIDDCDMVELNILHRKFKKMIDSNIFKQCQIITKLDYNKIYFNGSFLRCYLDEDIKEFLLNKPYESWINYPLEDVSLLKGKNEILATITHENYVIMRLTEEERNKLNIEGFHFINKL